MSSTWAPTMTASSGTPGDGNDAVDGQGGHNVLFFFGTNDAETLDLSAQGRRLRLSRDSRTSSWTSTT